jgi:hypothetical protein
MLCVSCCLRREGVGPSARFKVVVEKNNFCALLLSGPKRSYPGNLGARSFSYKPLCSTEMPQPRNSPAIKELSGFEREILWLPRDVAGTGAAPFARGARAMPPSRGAFCVRVALLDMPFQTEGTGNAGCWPHPWPACNKKAGGSHHRFSRDNRHSPRDGFNSCFAFSPVRRAFWPPSPARCVSIAANLIPATGYQDHAT